MEGASPVAVCYSLTEKGASLGPVLDELGDWADDRVALPDDVPVEESASRPGP
ncbi:winged helix-turn-helix transcriptional regulator [Haloglomus litoreum]|uniref:winged helix-turn-helix transcriptional regulator n=1 Tax=Haloglomus litoreum TaxID=3034026 RepID=UPI0023E7A598|nr:winged helix-turn-helix transcriptional regulator [Haloglomus sp. DT116]